MVLTSTKNNEVQFEFLDMRHARESLHLENKNMLRKIFRLKTEKTKNIRRLPSVLMILHKKRVLQGFLKSVLSGI